MSTDATDPGAAPAAPHAKPVMTERDASWHEAQAGIAAREAAAAQGADPAHLRALLLPLKQPMEIRGEKLHNTALLLTQCFLLYEELHGAQPQQALANVFAAADASELRLTSAQFRALSHLGFIFTRPLEAYELLDSSDAVPSVPSDPSDAPEQREMVRVKLRRVFDRAAAAHTAEWGEADFATLLAHLVRQAAARSALDVGK